MAGLPNNSGTGMGPLSGDTTFLRSSKTIRILLIVGLTSIFIPLLFWACVPIFRAGLLRRVHRLQTPRARRKVRTRLWHRPWHGHWGRDNRPDRGTEGAGLWRTSKQDYTWVFWDPHGEGEREHVERRKRSVLRFLPAWMRSLPPGASKPVLPARSHPLINIELGASHWGDNRRLRAVFDRFNAIGGTPRRSLAPHPSVDGTTVSSDAPNNVSRPGKHDDSDTTNGQKINPKQESYALEIGQEDEEKGEGREQQKR